MAREKLSRRGLLAVFFVATTLIASAFGLTSTANYYQFYTALAGLQLNLTSLTFTTVNNPPRATAVFAVENPTGYKGLTLKAFQPTYEIQTSNSTVIRAPESLLTPTTTGPIQPWTKISIPVSFTTTTTLTGSGLEFVFTVDLILSTFLDPAASVRASYQCRTTGAPGSCEQIAVTLFTRAEEGGGGGGGA